VVSDDIANKLEEIWKLLEEAYDHYFSYEGHCKSGEGTVELSYPSYFEMKDGKREPSVTIRSYVLGPDRSHDFDNIDDALTEVRKWHKQEMSYKPMQENNYE
jgi:hypothetical protein